MLLPALNGKHSLRQVPQKGRNMRMSHVLRVPEDGGGSGGPPEEVQPDTSVPAGNPPAESPAEGGAEPSAEAPSEDGNVQAPEAALPTEATASDDGAEGGNKDPSQDSTPEGGTADDAETDRHDEGGGDAA